MLKVGPRARQLLNILTGTELRKEVREYCQKQLRPPQTPQALATINGAPLSQKALNIKQVPPHVLLAISTLPDEPAWAAPSSGRSNHAREGVKQVIKRAIKHFPKPSKAKTALKAAVTVISGGLAGAGGLLIYATIPFLPYAAAGWLAVGGACLLTAAGVGLYALISGVAKNNTKKSFSKLFLDDVKREILAEELLKLDQEKSDAFITLLSHPEREESLKKLMDHIKIANNIVNSFNKGSRDTSVVQIDNLLKNFRHSERLSFRGRITEIKSHMDNFAQAVKIVSRRESYAASEQGLAQARVDREFLAAYSSRLDRSVEAELRLLHAVNSRLIKLEQIIADLEAQYGRLVLLERPKGPR